MTPIFSRKAIELAIPYFLDEPYGLGLETWWHVAFAPKGKLGVLDSTPVQHVRPLGSAHSMSGLGTGKRTHPFEIAHDFRVRHGFPEVFADDTAETLARWGLRRQDPRSLTLEPYRLPLSPKSVEPWMPPRPKNGPSTASHLSERLGGPRVHPQIPPRVRPTASRGY
jgi:hypothetical protein